MRILVIGAGGFVGEKLTSRLKDCDYEVFAGSRKPVQQGDIYIDILDKKSLDYAIKAISPDCVYHLAAQTKVWESWNDPKSFLETNAIGTLNVIESVMDYAPKTKVIMIGSSEEYGLSALQGVPLSEETPCNPQNPYAISKFAAGQLALQLGIKHNLNIIHVRAFNHYGPGQQTGFVISDFISQIVNIERALIEPVMTVGDLSALRDFTYIDDIIEAYISLLNRKVTPGMYNVCSKKNVSIQEILDTLLMLSNQTISVEIDAQRFRKNNVPIFLGSYDKLNQATGWFPKVNLVEGLSNTLEWWRTYKKV